MKKMLFLPVLALALCGVLWGEDFSVNAGAGGLVGGLFTRYKATGSYDSGKMTQKVNQINYGGVAFFDATYGELSVIIQGATNNFDEVMRMNNEMAPRDGDGWNTMLGFSLLGKYPFTLTERLCLFPLLGMDYQIALMQRRRQSGGIVYDRTNGIQETDKKNNPLDLSAWNSFWINLGAGVDFTLTKDFFLRGELLYGFRLMTAYEADGLEQMKELLDDNDPKLGGLTSGPSLRLGIGYRLWSK